MKEETQLGHHVDATRDVIKEKAQPNEEEMKKW